MPRPRFETLDPELRRQLLQRAAEAFQREGLRRASLNQILMKAGFSKGLFYYHFDDKRDLYVTVLDDAVRQFEAVLERSPRVEDLNALNFWCCLESSYQQLFAFGLQNPTVVGLVKTVADLPPDDLKHMNLDTRCHGWLQRFLERGQTLGVIRVDLPMEVLTQLASAVDACLGEWLVAHPGDSAETLKHTPKVVEMYRRVLEPEVQFPATDDDKGA